MQKPRVNRKFVAGLIFDVLVPLVREQGVVQSVPAFQRSSRLLTVQGLHVMLSDNVLERPTDESLRTVVEIWPERGTKVFSAREHLIKS